MTCICKELSSVLDPDAFDYDRADGVVIYNNSGYMVSTCESGHRSYVHSLFLCSPTWPEVSDAIRRHKVVVRRRYDSLGHPVDEE